MESKKVAVVTGAMGSLGMPTSVELARQGYRVVLVGRGAERLAEARTKVLEGAGAGAEVDVVECDLGALASIRSAAAELVRRYPKIHLLINNAAAFAGSRRTTRDGYELMVGTNHLAPYLLTRLLEAPLFAAGDARVVCLTMPTKKGPALEDLMSEKRFVPLHAFMMSKGLTQYFARELADRWAGKVAVFAVNPDMTKTTLIREAPLPLRIAFALFGATPEKAKAPIVYAATSSELRGKTGLYFAKKKSETFMAGSEDPGVRRKLWERSAELVGLPS